MQDELKALIILKEIEPIGKYDVIIKRDDEWYYYSKLYIKKITFDEIIKRQRNIKFLLYELGN